MIIIFGNGLLDSPFPGVYFVVRPLCEVDVDLSDSKTFFKFSYVCRLVIDKALCQAVVVEFGPRYGGNEIEPPAGVINPPEQIDGFLQGRLIFSRIAENQLDFYRDFELLGMLHSGLDLFDRYLFIHIVENFLTAGLDSIAQADTVGLFNQF